MCDALKTHEAGARDGPGIVLAGCWAHVYRKFEEAASDHPEAQTALALIGELYEIDARAGADVERRAVLRRTESVAVLNKLKEWLWNQAILKTLSIGKAAGYAIANWERLTRFVERHPAQSLANVRAQYPFWLHLHVVEEPIRGFKLRVAQGIGKARIRLRAMR